MLRLLSGCRHAHAASAVASVAVRWLRRADLGTEEIACRTAQNLYSLRRSRVRVTDATKFIEAQRAPKVYGTPKAIEYCPVFLSLGPKLGPSSSAAS